MALMRATDSVSRKEIVRYLIGEGAAVNEKNKVSK